ncbi:transketolase, partial [Enterobacter hormaechei]|nr:transketolase [Enterobacter hormaechei]
GHDSGAIAAAIEAARQETGKPSLLMCKTIIGFGSPNKAGKEECHGAPLGDAEIEATRKALGWEHPAFDIPQDIYAGWNAQESGKTKEAAWDEKFAAYANAYPELAA